MKTLLLLSLFFSVSLKAQTLHVAVASNFLSPFEVLKKEFEKASTAEVLISSGSSGKLAAQIQQGAPYDLFFSADQKRVSLLEKKNLLQNQSRQTYAKGRLALFLPHSSIQKKTLKDVLRSDFEHLSMANPKLAPYGVAAKELLQKLSLWDSLRPKIVYGNNISQAYQFVTSGAASAGLVALAQVKSHHKKGAYKKVPHKWHSPIVQEAAILKSSKNLKLAQKFLNFIQSDRGQNIIRSFGYETKGGNQS